MNFLIPLVPVFHSIYEGLVRSVSNVKLNFESIPWWACCTRCKDFLEGGEDGTGSCCKKDDQFWQGTEVTTSVADNKLKGNYLL